ncbi:MAG TPA: methyltransferase domain-containing protein [Bryobacteraceae bacterium]|nr:methyltransferase domain-containing protein [Bryobacteraceae bacterium]
MAEFTGERIIPGQVDNDLLNEHLARYAFASRLARGKRVLDAGCGTGYGSAELAKVALSVNAVDVAPDALAWAREHFPLPNLCFEQASATALPHPDASFDLVVSFEVIEHLEDWAAFLREVRRVLVPCGQFIVSTPNRLYYAETRERTGPNPFHVHEFDYTEFRAELTAVFPHVSLFLENHAAGVVFQPVDGSAPAEIRVDAGEPLPEEAHFFVAVCAHRPQTGSPTFVYLPRAANLLRERERHIDLLEGELRTKDEWLENAKGELAALNAKHRALKEELEQRNRWAQDLNEQLGTAAANIRQFQEAIDAYDVRVAELESENDAKTAWALATGKELDAKCQELAHAVELLNTAESLVIERTNWALDLQGRVEHLEGILAMCRSSRWVKLGRRVGLGPALPES